MFFSLELIVQSLITGILIGGVYSLVATGLNLIFGVMGIINFAHGSLMMLGMYVALFAFSFFKLDPYFSIILSVPLLFFIGLIIQRVVITPVLNKPHINQIILTLGLMLVIDHSVAKIFGTNDRSIMLSYSVSSLSFWKVSLSIPRFVTFCFAVVINYLIYLFLKKTDVGRAIRAASEEKYAAQLVGINVNWINLIAFGIGVACVGAAGSVIMSFHPVSPYVGEKFLFTAFVITLLGGLGNLMGGFWAAMIIGMVESLSQIILSTSLAQLSSFCILILILLFKPSGLFGTLEKR
jgi:branched-chain amino acid transport system permease protein